MQHFCSAIKHVQHIHGHMIKYYYYSVS